MNTIILLRIAIPQNIVRITLFLVKNLSMCNNWDLNRPQYQLHSHLKNLEKKLLERSALVFASVAIQNTINNNCFIFIANLKKDDYRKTYFKIIHPFTFSFAQMTDLKPY